MENLEDFITEFNRTTFVKNAMYTIVFKFGLSIPKVFVILIRANKNQQRSQFTSKSDYLNYLRSN